MTESKTKPTVQSVEEFLNAIPDEQKRADALALAKLIKQVTRFEPTMWGGSIVGYGSYHYKYASGREGDACLVGFSPRKQNFTLYLMLGVADYSDLLDKLGKHKTGKGCLYINTLADVDVPTLKELIKRAVKQLKSMYP
ncbi:MAG: DUF1801 domain-containing protein [Thermoflexales bacterium]|nr:DUF1801 domain-containing protein [Thermoflexales bacterium]